MNQHVSTVGFENLTVTVVTLEEQIRGWLNLIRRESGSEKVIWAYSGLEDAVLFFNRIEVLSFSEVACSIYSNLRQKKVRVGTQDLRIASITLSVNGTLVTRNRRDFEKIQGLRFDDWTVGEPIQSNNS